MNMDALGVLGANMNTNYVLARQCNRSSFSLIEIVACVFRFHHSSNVYVCLCFRIRKGEREREIFRLNALI